MNWFQEWVAIAAQIDGLLGAGHFFIRAQGINSSDSYGVNSKLVSSAHSVFEKLRTYYESQKDFIPLGASNALSKFLQDQKDHFPESDKALDRLKVTLTLLALLRSEIEYQLSDFETVALKRAERAFLHLRQTIAANESTRDAWKKAFDRGETACEKLGAAHLMFHGIWAFKANAEGGRTDLIFGDTIESADRVNAVADALVLTEWKVAKNPEDAAQKAREARHQMHLYTTGILSGIELSQRRFVVLVSDDQLNDITDVEENSKIYRHVNIPVQPNVPSKAAKKRHK